MNEELESKYLESRYMRTLARIGHAGEDLHEIQMELERRHRSGDKPAGITAEEIGNAARRLNEAYLGGRRVLDQMRRERRRKEVNAT